MKGPFLPLLFTFVLISCNSHKIAEVGKNNDTVFEANKENPKTIDPRNIVKYLESAPVIIPNKKLGAPFDTLQYNKVIVYDFDGSHEQFPIFKNNLIRNFTITKQQYLLQDQAEKILTVLTTKSTYGGTPMGCFEPRFAIVFFDNNSIVNQINVCLDCNYYRSELEIPAQKSVLYKKVKKEERFALTGFSKKGRKRTIDFCKDLDFKYGLY